MKLKCFFGIHDWELKEEYIVISAKYSNRTIDVSTKSRFCRKCSKKQIIKPGDGNWVDYNYLSKSEIREKKLNQLGL